MSKPFFSVCVPNYNYGGYIAETIESALNQPGQDIEVVVADNASTDNSVEVVQTLIAKHDNIKLKVNRCNVGFYENLKRAATMASGEWMTMLSSDDLATPEAYPTYKKIIDELGDLADGTILSSIADYINSEGDFVKSSGVYWHMWSGAIKDEKLSELVGCNVWRIGAKKLLKNSLIKLRTPFYFATTTYSKKLYDAIEGYSWGGIINPDKQFSWRLLSVANEAIIVEKPLFKYRWHDQNQTAQQTNSGALKHLVDQYNATFSLSNDILNLVGLTREDVENSFVNEDIVLRGALDLANGDRIKARRTIMFGKACYPQLVKNDYRIYAINIGLNLGPIGSYIFKILRMKYEKV